MPLTDAEVKEAMRDNSPIQLGGLRFVYLSGGYRVELPPNRDEEAVPLTAGQAEELCVWLSMKIDCVREYIARLKQSNNAEPSLPQTATLGERMLYAIKRMRQSEQCPRRNGNNSWLATRIGKSRSSVCRYLQDQVVPTPKIAKRIAAVLGWNQADMDRWCSAERDRKLSKENHA